MHIINHTFHQASLGYGVLEGVRNEACRTLAHPHCSRVPPGVYATYSPLPVIKGLHEVLVIDLVTVLEAILTSRQLPEKLPCLYENLMSNNFRKTAVLTILA